MTALAEGTALADSAAAAAPAPTGPAAPTGLVEPAGTAQMGFRSRVRQVIADQVAPLVGPAERDRRFPREAVEAFGAAGLFAQRWAGGGHGDLRRCVTLAEELGLAGLGGVGVGLSLHLEAASGLLVRFARTPYTRAVRDQALAGRAVLCLATSEQHAGSDLTAVATQLRPAGDGWSVQGTKWFVSPGSQADFALILCRAEEGPAIVVVPRSALVVHKRLETTGLRSLETVRLTVDAQVPDEAVLVRPGLGLEAVTWGLIHERLALAAQVLGGAALAVSLAATRLRRREQFGVPLFEHQALRLRLAELSAQVTLARHGVYGLAGGLGARRAGRQRPGPQQPDPQQPGGQPEDGAARDPETSAGPVSMRDVAGAKAVVAKLAQEVTAECAHMFGGTGYLEDETPFPRLLRDVRVARLGAGSDEMMWELVATGLNSDDELYDRWVHQ
ncbi:MAG TPA: acyl-CoA dehydrogenase family protein [Micromonosporaceae bacterium]|nr:acyl-CoA dehydrogenase family protein [Micromonosporaceae bacterium]